MPQTKSKTSPTVHNVRPITEAGPCPALLNARELMGKMMDYESAAFKNGIDLTSGRFKMLTASEADFLKAELVSDYIRLSVGNMGNTPGYYDAALRDFCAKICDLEVPSHELLGTYLAAVEIAATEKGIKDVPGLADAVRRTVIDVLQACVETMGEKSKAVRPSC